MFTIERDRAGSSDPSGEVGEGMARSPRPARGRRRLTVPLLLQLGAMIGIGALAYPSAADWFATLHHNSEVSGYIEAVEAIPDAEVEARLQAARDYNSHMPQGVLRDPYSAPIEGEEHDAAYRAYEELLRIGESDVIGQLDYPELGISLPVYHGTSEDVIAQGVGHLYGSSLPVGGPSTHSVLTSHSGLLHAALFTKLPSAETGDVFELTVLGETRFYRVDRLETVLPEQTEGLTIVPGEDLVTLITCTPIGINSHRLLVTGERIPGPVAAGPATIAGDGKTAGFPWWAVAFLAGSGAVAYLLFVPPRTRRRDGSSETEHTEEVRA